MTTRQTAAARRVEIEYEVPARIADLADANEAFAAKVEQKLVAQREYDNRKAKLDHEKQVIAEGVAATCYRNNTKVTQAEIDRKVKSELFDNDVYRDLEEKANEAKRKLDEAVAEYEVARIHHRTLVTQTTAAAAALNFLSASRTARAIALQNINDL